MLGGASLCVDLDGGGGVRRVCRRRCQADMRGLVTAVRCFRRERVACL